MASWALLGMEAHETCAGLGAGVGRGSYSCKRGDSSEHGDANFVGIGLPLSRAIWLMMYSVVYFSSRIKEQVNNRK